MSKESDILLDCSNELYRLARETADLRWKRELMQRAREIGDMREATGVVIVLTNLVVEADRQMREAA